MDLTETVIIVILNNIARKKQFLRNVSIWKLNYALFSFYTYRYECTNFERVVPTLLSDFGTLMDIKFRLVSTRIPHIYFRSSSSTFYLENVVEASLLGKSLLLLTVSQNFCIFGAWSNFRLSIILSGSSKIQKINTIILFWIYP